MKLLGQTAVLISVAIMAVGCRQYSEPETALRSYADAVRERRCSDSLELISSRTRYALDVLLEKPQHPHNPLPLEGYYCNKFTFDECKSTKTLKAADVDAATVAMSCG